jgi:ABC-type Na+ efflux pump permease subunit
MRRIWLMAKKDLLRQLRSPLAMSMVLAFPIVFAGLLALAFGGGGGMPKVHLLIEDRDESMLSGLLVGALGSEQMGEFFRVEEAGADGLARMENGEASALLRIPEGFADDLLAGEPLTLELIRNPAQGILPEIAEQSAVVLAELLSEGSRVLRRPLAQWAALNEAESVTSAQTLEISVAFHDAINEAQKMVLPPAITLESVQLRKAGEDEPSGSTRALVFLLVLPGISVWALFLVADNAMRDLLVESRLRTLHRQLAGPVPTWEIIAGKALYTAVLAAICLVILSAIGWLTAGRPIDPVAYLLLSGAVVVAVTGYASVVYGLAGTERQGSTFSSILLLAFAFIGGSFIQVDNLPESVRRFSPLSPFYWGTTGYQSLIRDGVGVGEVLTNIVVLVSLGLVLFVAGAALQGRKVRSGVAA